MFGNVFSRGFKKWSKNIQKGGKTADFYWNKLFNDDLALNYNCEITGFTELIVHIEW